MCTRAGAGCKRSAAAEGNDIVSVCTRAGAGCKRSAARGGDPAPRHVDLPDPKGTRAVAVPRGIARGLRQRTRRHRARATPRGYMRRQPSCSAQVAAPRAIYVPALALLPRTCTGLSILLACGDATARCARRRGAERRAPSARSSGEAAGTLRRCSMGAGYCAGLAAYQGWSRGTNMEAQPHSNARRSGALRPFPR